jgi:hypothetical protein
MVIHSRSHQMETKMKDELKRLLRTDFLSFSRKAIFEQSGTKLSRDRYLEYLATELTEFIDGNTKRLLVSLPPRHIKTLLSSVCLSAWVFAQRPSAKIMVVTYSEQLAETMPVQSAASCNLLGSKRSSSPGSLGITPP